MGFEDKQAAAKRCNVSASFPPVIYSTCSKTRRPPAESLANQKNFKRTSGSAHEARETNPKEKHMLWTIFVILLILWLLGLVSSYTLGGFIHLLLVIAVVILIINLVSGRKSL